MKRRWARADSPLTFATCTQRPSLLTLIDANIVECFWCHLVLIFRLFRSFTHFTCHDATQLCKDAFNSLILVSKAGLTRRCSYYCQSGALSFQNCWLDAYISGSTSWSITKWKVFDSILKISIADRKMSQLELTVVRPLFSQTDSRQLSLRTNCRNQFHEIRGIPVCQPSSV